jgi:hypothetical protein
MAINWVLPARVAQLVFSVIVLGLTAYGKLQTSSISSAFKHALSP